MRFPYSHDILMCVQIIWKLQSHKPTSAAAILRLPISTSSGIEKYYRWGLFFAMPLSLSFLQQRSYYSRYSEKYCMCALCVHWVCNNIQGALSPESLLRPSISLLLNLGQKEEIIPYWCKYNSTILLSQRYFGCLFAKISLNTFQKGSDDSEICRLGSSYNLFLINFGIT